MNERLIHYLTEAIGELATLLAQSHGRELNLIMTLENTELTAAQRSLVAAARYELRQDQNALLAKYGDYAKPGVN
jgi:hypothetical protein